MAKPQSYTWNRFSRKAPRRCPESERGVTHFPRSPLYVLAAGAVAIYAHIREPRSSVDVFLLPRYIVQRANEHGAQVIFFFYFDLFVRRIFSAKLHIGFAIHDEVGYSTNQVVLRAKKKLYKCERCMNI